MSSRRPTTNPHPPNRSRVPRCPHTSPVAKNRTASARRASPLHSSPAESPASVSTISPPWHFGLLRAQARQVPHEVPRAQARREPHEVLFLHQLLGVLHNIGHADAQLLHRNRPWSRCAEPVNPDHRAVVSHILPPAIVAPASSDTFGTPSGSSSALYAAVCSS